MNELVKYDAMCSAIVACHSVDELKDMKDKAAALELYAKQAGNMDAEMRAAEIRLRAACRMGELLKDLAKATPAQAGAAGGRGKTKESVSHGETRFHSPYADALQRTGISRQQANRYEALADVPKETFEAAFKQPGKDGKLDKPTMNAILERNKAMAQVREAVDPQPRMPSDALWLWGRMRDFEREGFSGKDPDALLEGMTETMRADVLRIAPLMADFFGRIQENMNELA